MIKSEDMNSGVEMRDLLSLRFLWLNIGTDFNRGPV